jgi:hypothetical protein
MSENATESIGSVTAIPSYNSGYGLGMVAFYIESGMVADTPYVFRVQQNPAIYSSPDYWDFTIGNSNYSSSGGQSAALKAKIIDIATYLTTEFETALLTTSESGSTVLSTYGELYFLESIPGLQLMCPELFSVQIETPDFEKKSWSMVFADALQTKYADTFLGDFMTGYAGLFSLETSVAMNSLSVLIFIVIVVFSVLKFKATILSSLLDGYAGLLLLMLSGVFSMVWAGFIAFASAMAGGAILLFKRS